MADDDFDLTDRFEQLEGNTLSDDWEENPDPPEGYGQPDGRTILEVIGDTTWVWATHKKDATIRYCGKRLTIKQ